jgi:hypothetical protein
MLYQFLGSAVAVALLVALAAWARIARPTPPLDEASAARILADEFPSLSPTRLWLTEDGTGAVARAGDQALLLRRTGDGYVARKFPWAELSGAAVEDGRVTLKLADVGSPRFALAWPSSLAWPPEGA